MSINDFSVFGMTPIVFLALMTLLFYFVKEIPAPRKYKTVVYDLILIAMAVYVIALFYEVYPYLA